MVVRESNRYAKQVLDATRFAKWTPLTSADIEAFFGFNFLMGLNPKPSLVDYWKKDPVFNYPPIADRISRNR